MKKIACCIGLVSLAALLAATAMEGESRAGSADHHHHGHGRNCPYRGCGYPAAYWGYRHNGCPSPRPYVCYQPFPGHPVVCREVAPRGPWRRPCGGGFSFWTTGWAFAGAF